MNISCFDDLLRVARQQIEPQRLLFVFASADLPDDSTPAQRTRFAAGEGGALVPIMCVDKSTDELHTFDDLAREAGQFGKQWSIVFAAALSGSAGLAPSSEAAEKPLQRMVESIKAGNLGSYIPFDQQGQAVQLE